ncbi:MAG TPA: energy transducer TonB [Candidatus Acidoferrales bacterium]
MPELNPHIQDTAPSGPENTLRIGRLPSPVRDSELKSFFSNLKEFLTERPVKIKGAKSDVFKQPEFGESLNDNFKEFFKPAPRGPVNSDLLVDWKPGLGGFWQNIKDTISPPKLAPLRTTSKPIAVPEIWSKNTQFTRVQAMSVAVHVLILVLILVPLLPRLLNPPTTKANTKVEVMPISPYLPKMPAGAKKAGGGGGGGAHDIQPASVGKLAKFSMTQFTPPKVNPNIHPKLAMTPTVLGPPEIKLPSPNMNTWGDPLAKVLNDSNGTGGGNGIGSGQGTGVGSGSGGGVGPGEGGGTGGGVFNAGTGGYGYPTCLYCPTAQYSDEAIKAKYQGMVLLSVVVTPDGKATDIHVVKGLGLGLDEKAIEAVRTWHFRAAMGPNQKPAPVRLTVEVVFRLF